MVGVRRPLLSARRVQAARFLQKAPSDFAFVERVEHHDADVFEIDRVLHEAVCVHRRVGKRRAKRRARVVIAEAEIERDFDVLEYLLELGIFLGLAAVDEIARRDDGDGPGLSFMDGAEHGPKARFVALLV